MRNDTRRSGRPPSPNRARNGSRPGQSRQSHSRNNGDAGNAKRNYERYVALARSAALNGDTVEAENFYQHAEHYFRIANNTSGEEII